MSFGTPQLLLAVSTDWMVPLWLLGIGTLVGVVILLGLWGLTKLLSGPIGRGVDEIVQEGPLAPVGILLALLGGFALCITPIVPYSLFWQSLVRIPATRGSVTREFTLEPSEVDRKEPFALLRDELKSFSIVSDQNVIVMPDIENPDAEGSRMSDGRFSIREVRGGQPATWQRLRRQKNPFAEDCQNLWLTNLSSSPAKVKISYTSGLVTPEVLLVPQAAAFVVGLGLLYVFVRALFPKMGAIAVATSKEGVGQPLFSVVLLLGLVLMVIFTFLPYNTFGEDLKIFKSATLSVTMILGILVALWTASVSISDEIEGRTALTVLSKPVGRRQFVLGKFIGVLGPVILLFLIMGTTNLALTSFKTLYDAREAALTDVTWRDCFAEMYTMLPNMVLVFLQTTVLAAISVAISTRLGMLPNLIICITIYVVGNLLPQLVQSSIGKFEIVEFMAQFLALLLPVLTHFDINVPTAAGKPVSLEYLGSATLYCVMYSSFAMLIALFLFEDRDVG